MVNSTKSGNSIFKGNWEKETPSENIHCITRLVRVNGKTYRMRVGYKPVASEQGNHPNESQVIKNVIEGSEAEIECFLRTHRPGRGESGIAVTTNLTKRRGAYTINCRRGISKRQHSARSKMISSLAWEYRKQTMQFPHLKKATAKVFESQANHTKFIGEAYAQKGLDLIDKLKGFGQEGPVEYEGKKYVIPSFDKYGRRKWEVEIDGRHYEINEFKQDAYNSVQVEDFLKRQELVYQAGLRYLEKNQPVMKDELLNGLETLNHSFKNDLTGHEYQFQWQNILSDEAIAEQFAEINQLATERIAQFAKDVQFLITQIPGCEEFSIADLDHLEREHVLERGRPIVLNTFEAYGKKFVHMHLPESKEFRGHLSPKPKNTIPSTMRDRPGLGNYVTSYGGTLSPDGKVTITYEAMRHTSYAPLRVSSSTSRQAIAAENVKQGLQDLAYKMLQAEERKTSAEEPLVIPLRSMILLTPLVGGVMLNRSRFIAGEWMGESESLQLRESVFALRMFNGRTIPLQFGEDIVWVKPDISMMNLGSNAEAAGLGLFGKTPLDGFQRMVNAKGFVEFIDDIETCLREADLPKDLRQALCELEGIDQGSKKVALGREQVARVTKAREVQLKKLYSELEGLYAEYRVAGRKAVKEKIKERTKQIHQLENEVYEVHLKLQSVMQKEFLENRAAFAVKEEELNSRFKEHILNEQDPEKRAVIEKALNISNNLCLAKSYFYEGKTNKPESVMEFQSIYIQTYSMLDKFVEFFCKSGEDRTGRMDDKVLEREVYREMFQRVPVTFEDQRVIEEKLALLIHQFTASQNTTEQNSNARGEQISYKVNREVPARLDLMQATLAKRVFDNAKKLKPSKEAYHIASLMAPPKT